MTPYDGARITDVEWNDPPEKCPECGLPLRDHWRQRPCLKDCEGPREMTREEQAMFGPACEVIEPFDEGEGPREGKS